MCGRLSQPPPATERIEFSDVPDLAMPPPPQSLGRSSPNLAAPVKPPPPQQSKPSEAFDTDDIFATGGGGGAPLELDLGTGGKSLPPHLSSSSMRAAPLIEARVSVAAGPSAGAKVPSPSFDRHRPAEPPGAEGEIDPFDARALADYGEAPTKPWLAPIYAFRVLTRKAELKRLLTTARDEAVRASLRSEDVLVAFAERARVVIEKNPGQARALEEVVAAESLLRSRDGAMAGDMDAMRGRLSSIDARITSLEGELLAAQAEEKRVADELAQVVAVRDRADTKMKRAEIEIRNAEALLESKRQPRPGVRKP
jgi:hypothetical protein